MGIKLDPIVSEALDPNYVGKVNIWSGTQAEYDALSTYEDDIVYLVVDE